MNLSGGKGPNVHTEFKEKPNFICRRFKNLKGRKSASAPLSFSGHKWGKNTAGVGRENSLHCSPQHFKSQKTLSKLCTTTVRRNVSFFDWNGIFFSPPVLQICWRFVSSLWQKGTEQSAGRHASRLKKVTEQQKKREFLGKKSSRQKKTSSSVLAAGGWKWAEKLNISLTRC